MRRWAWAAGACLASLLAGPAHAAVTPPGAAPPAVAPPAAAPPAIAPPAAPAPPAVPAPPAAPARGAACGAAQLGGRRACCRGRGGGCRRSPAREGALRTAGQAVSDRAGSRRGTAGAQDLGRERHGVAGPPAAGRERGGCRGRPDDRGRHSPRALLASDLRTTAADHLGEDGFRRHGVPLRDVGRIHVRARQ